MTPHIGSASRATRMKMGMLGAANLVVALAGKRPPNLLLGRRTPLATADSLPSVVKKVIILSASPSLVLFMAIPLVLYVLIHYRRAGAGADDISARVQKLLGLGQRPDAA